MDPDPDPDLDTDPASDSEPTRTGPDRIGRGRLWSNTAGGRRTNQGAASL